MQKSKRQNRNKSNKRAGKGHQVKSPVSSNDAQKCIDLSIKYMQEGALHNAMEEINKVLSVDANNADAHNVVGVIMLTAGNPTQAIIHFKGAISINDLSPDFHFNNALAHIELNELQVAIDELHKAITLRKEYFQAWNTLSSVLMAIARMDDAKQAAETAILYEPKCGEAWVNLCGIYQDQKLHDQAIEAGKNAIKYCPDVPQSYYNLARALDGDERWDEAIKQYQVCMALFPTFANSYVNCSRCLIVKHQYAEAEELAQEAVNIEPDNPEANKFLGRAKCQLGDYKAALPYQQKALKLNPGSVEYQADLAMSLLIQEEFSTGWDKFDSLLKNGHQSSFPDTSIPIWKGEPLRGKKIYVIGEQGIGEQIMYATMLEDLIKDGASITYECEERLIPIFIRSIEAIDLVKQGSEPDPAIIDYIIHVGSLGKFYRRSVEDFKPKKNYLVADPDLTRHYTEKYRSLGDGLKIGISWKSPNSSYAHKRDIPLSQWKPIFDTPGCIFISLQYGDVEDDCALLKNELGVDVYIDPEVSSIESLEQGMAQACSVDLVISIANATIDLAASCGTDTWMMLGKTPFWHWFDCRNDSLWYDTVRVFRQKELGEWDDIIHTIAEELSSFVEGGSELPKPKF